MKLGNAVTLQRDFAETIADVRIALADQGFGVLTEIDMQATLKAKIGVDIDPYLILGACNPPLAHRAISADPSLGLLLPCNVIVRTSGTATIVEFVDPNVLVDFSESPDVRSIAAEVAQRLDAALAAVSA